MIKLAISGAQGRMGQRITYYALKDKNFSVKTLLERENHPEVSNKVEGLNVTTDISELAGNDVLIEFTAPEATVNHVKACRKNGVNMVIGTTGMTFGQIREIKNASKDIAIVFSSNMSVGVNIMFKLTQMAAQKCGKNYTMNLTEAHHIHKKDAPSGTAKTIAEIAEQASKRKVQDIKSIREGEIIGDHDIVFESDEDIITITHHAKTRDIFAKGSLVAAKFVAEKKSGLFTMQDVLGMS